jgi:ketosteroid isomerase-like protein
MTTATIATFDIQEAQRFASEFGELFSKGDYATMSSFYTEDARLMMDDMEMVQGRQAIEQFWKSACRMAGIMQHIINVQEVGTSGDIGYTVGTITLRIQASPEKVITNMNKYATVWKRSASGQWQLAIDIVNRNSPMEIPAEWANMEIPAEWADASIDNFLQNKGV